MSRCKVLVLDCWWWGCQPASRTPVRQRRAQPRDLGRGFMLSAGLPMVLKA